MKNRVILIFIGGVLLMSSVGIYFFVATNKRSVSTSATVNPAASFTLEPTFTFEPFFNTANLVAFSDRNRSVLIRKDDGTAERIVYTPALPDGTPHGFTWSPDGKRLVFFESRTGDSNKRILLIDLVQGKVYLVRSLSRNLSGSHVAWSPSSDQIALVEIKEIDSRAGLYVGGLYVVDIFNSSVDLPHITLPGVDTLPGIVQWVADGIYYVSKGKLMKFHPRQRSATPVVDVANKSVTAFAISAEKKKLAYALNTGEVFLRDLSRQTVVEQLVSDFPQDYVEEFAFSPSEKYVVGYIGLGHYFYFRVDISNIVIEDFPSGYDPTWDFPSLDAVDEYDGKLLLTNGGKIFLYNVDTKTVENVDEQARKRMFGVHN